MGLYDGLKDAAKVLQEAGKIEQYKEILAAQQKMMEMQETISELKSTNLDLEEKLKIKGDLKFRNNAYWIDGDNEPFCSRCWEADKKPIHLHPDGNPAYYKCPNCNADSVVVKPELDTPPRAHVYYPNPAR